MKPWSGIKAGLLIAVLAGLAAACQAGAATTVVSSSPTTSSPTTSAKSAARHPGGVSSHIRLASATLVSGAAEHGTLVVVNHTARPMHWNCGYFDVQLTNAHHPLEIHPTPCSLHGKTFRAGTTTRLPFTLRASQVVCQGSCAALPPGTYRTQVFAAPTFVHPPAVTVHVTAAR